MKRSSDSERAQRLNTALALIRQHRSLAKAASELAACTGISRRQAYRYIREAEATGKPVRVPRPKITFSIKVSIDLIQALRKYAASTGKTLSEIVTQALELFLSRRQGRG